VRVTPDASPTGPVGRASARRRSRPRRPLSALKADLGWAGCASLKAVRYRGHTVHRERPGLMCWQNHVNRCPARLSLCVTSVSPVAKSNGCSPCGIPVIHRERTATSVGRPGFNPSAGVVRGGWDTRCRRWPVRFSAIFPRPVSGGRPGPAGQSGPGPGALNPGARSP
jgi:hypothetical protein